MHLENVCSWWTQFIDKISLQHNFSDLMPILHNFIQWMRQLAIITKKLFHCLFILINLVSSIFMFHSWKYNKTYYPAPNELHS